MKTIRIALAVSEREKEMLNKVCESMGCNSSELIRNLIRDEYTKVFPPYKASKAQPYTVEEKLTPEQRCERVGGQVKEIDGQMKCYVEKINMGPKVGGVHVPSKFVQVFPLGDDRIDQLLE